MFGKAYDDPNPFETKTDIHTSFHSTNNDDFGEMNADEKDSFKTRHNKPKKHINTSDNTKYKNRVRLRYKYKYGKSSKTKYNNDINDNFDINNIGLVSKQEYIKNIKTKTDDALDRCLPTTNDIEQTAVDTLGTLNGQTHQLKRINNMLDDTNETLSYTQYTLNGMKSWFGSFKNRFKKPRKYTNVFRNKSKNKSIKSVHNNEILSKSNNNSDNITQNDDEVDKKLDELLCNIKKINDMANDANNTILCHNELLNEIEYGMDKAQDSLISQNHQISNIY